MYSSEMPKTLYKSTVSVVQSSCMLCQFIAAHGCRRQFLFEKSEKKSRRYRQLTIVDYKKSFYQKLNRIFCLVLSKAYCDEHQKLDEFTQTSFARRFLLYFVNGTLNY